MSSKNAIAYTEDKEAYVRQLIEDRVTIYPTTAARIMCEHFGIEYNEEIGRNYRAKFQQDLKLVNTVSYRRAQQRVLPRSKYYLLSSAQNSTPVFSNLLKNMEALAEFLNGEIGIIASRYRNPNLFDEGLKKNYWDESIEKYLIASRMQIFKNFIVGADVRIPYTTNRPVTNAKRLCNDFNFVVGHPKQDFESLPALDGQLKRHIYTTGSITLPNNYSDTMAGAAGSENHVNGFLLVEVVDADAGEYTILNVDSDMEGNFIIPGIKVTNGYVGEIDQSIEAIVVGDLHVGFSNEEAEEKTYNYVKKYLPGHVVLHDVLSAESVHRYNINDAFKAYKLQEEGITIEKEIDMAIDTIHDYKELSGVVVVPAANHHFILEGWIKNFSWKSSLGNAKKYFELSSMLLNKEVGDKGIFAELVDREEIQGVETLSYNDSYKILGTEVGQHGDKGVNGSRGGVQQYERTGIPHIVGHGHGPQKFGDTIMVGTLSKERMGYNQGYSTWRDDVVGLIFKNGKRAYHKI